LIGITEIFLALSLAGPALVKGVLAVFKDPTGFQASASSPSPPVRQDQGGVVPSEWPLVLALAIVGLAHRCRYYANRSSFYGD
jgi:hypothetical protein